MKTAKSIAIFAEKILDSDLMSGLPHSVDQFFKLIEMKEIRFALYHELLNLKLRLQEVVKDDHSNKPK